MIPRPLIERLFSAASIQRWNDRVRPCELTELDKQAHKAMIAYVLARFEEDRGREVRWIPLIEGLLFEFLPRVVLTDIKAPFFHRLMKIHGDAVRTHVIEQLRPEFGDWNPAFAGRFEKFLGDGDDATLERRLLKAAHYLATQWEFTIVHHVSSFLYGSESTRREIENQLEDFIDLVGVQRISLKQKAYGFLDLCGQLRFQQRWAQTPRLPATTVLGHSFFVAAMSYLLVLDLDACAQRRINAFFAGLFHDLPEIFTRDIISPIKRGVAGLERFIEAEERHHVKEFLLPLVPDGWHEQLRYYLENPFRDKIRVNGKVTLLADHRQLHTAHDSNEDDPLDGTIVHGCDGFAAFIEARKSIENGIDPPALVRGARYFLDRTREPGDTLIPWSDYFRYYPDPPAAG